MEGYMRIAVVGHTGQMGKMFCERLKNMHEIKGVDIPLTEKKIQECVHDAEVVILCVPARFMHQVTRQVVPYLAQNCILMDITSVKVMPIKSMEELYQGPVVGTHPLFGPRSQDYRKVCFCKGKWFENPTTDENLKSTLWDKAQQVFLDMDCHLFEATAEEHDTAMGAMQGLNFVTNVAFFAMTANMENIREFLTPSFMRRLESAKPLLLNDGELFMGLFDYNPYSQKLVKQYRSFLNVAAGGDMSVLVELAKKWFKEE